MKLTTVWKFPLEVLATYTQKISIPRDYRILHVGIDPEGRICLWAAIDHTAPKRDVEIRIAGTGEWLSRVGSYIGTVVDGPFVWHVFTGPEETSNGANREFHYATRDNG